MPIVLNHQSFNFAHELRNDPLVKPLLRRLAAHHWPTYQHVLRVGLLATDIALDRHFSDWAVSVVGLGGMLHDVGKCSVPTMTLDSGGALDALNQSDRALLRDHPRLGVSLLEQSSFYLDRRFPMVRAIVAAHHEFQRDAYPLSGPRDASFSGYELEYPQIVAVADALDALRSGRSYQRPFPPSAIHAALAANFTGNPALVAAALRRLPS